MKYRITLWVSTTTCGVDSFFGSLSLSAAPPLHARHRVVLVLLLLLVLILLLHWLVGSVDPSYTAGVEMNWFPCCCWKRTIGQWGTDDGHRQLISVINEYINMVPEIWVKIKCDIYIPIKRHLWRSELDK